MASSLLSPLAREGRDDDSDHWDELAAHIIPRNGRARVDSGGSERVSKGAPQSCGPHCVLDSRATEQRRNLNFFEWSRTMTRHAVVMARHRREMSGGSQRLDHRAEGRSREATAPWF